MAIYEMEKKEKKQSKALTERTKKYECEMCGKPIRLKKKKQTVCDTCKKFI